MTTLGENIKQEIRNTIAVHGRETIMRSKAGGAKVADQQSMLEKTFHGTDNHTPLLETFLSGKPPYEAAFNRYELQNNREGNETRKKLKQEYMLELKDILHCQTGTQVIVHERGFTKEAICNLSENKLIDGRNLNDRALSVCASYKQAHRFNLEYSNGKENNPSGKKFEDMLLFVRKKMYSFYKGCKDAKGYAHLKDKTKVVLEEDMPSTYVFTGQFAFTLFGPQPMSKISFSCLVPDESGIPKQSRKAAKKEEAKAKQKDRETGTGGYVPKEYAKGDGRGVPLQAKANAAHLAQKEWIEERQNVRDLLFIASTDYSTTLKELKDVNELIRDADDDEELVELKKWKSEVFENLSCLRCHKRKLEERSTLLMEQSKPKKAAMNAFMDQVGNFGYGTPDREWSVPTSVESSTATGTKDDTSSISFSSTAPSETTPVQRVVVGNNQPAAVSANKNGQVDTPEDERSIEQILAEANPATQTQTQTQTEATAEVVDLVSATQSTENTSAQEATTKVQEATTEEPSTEDCYRSLESRLDATGKRLLAQYREAQARKQGKDTFDPHDYYGCYD